MNIKIILASGSPRRRELLHQVGLTPEIVPSQADETITSTEPDQVVMELSARKAKEVAAGHRSGGRREDPGKAQDQRGGRSYVKAPPGQASPGLYRSYHDICGTGRAVYLCRTD